MENINNSKPLGVIANRHFDSLANMVSLLQNPDKVLKDNNIPLSAFKDLTYDSHVYSCIQSRKSAIVSMEYDIIDESGIYKDFIQKVVDSIDIHKLISALLDAPLYGYSVSEVIYTTMDGLIMPKDIIPKPFEWFKFDRMGILYFLANDGTEVLCENYKFVVAKHNASYVNPYGESVLSRCFYPVIFKKGTMQYWAEFLQKYGSPILHGTVTDSLGDMAKNLNEFTTALINAISSSIIATPEGYTINALNAAGASNSDVFKNFLHWNNSEISKAILSQTLTTEQGDTGSYAMSQTHLQVRKDVVDADKKLVEEAMNSFIVNLIDLNFADVKSYPIFRLYEEEDIDMQLAERDTKLMATGQVKFTKEYFVRNYGFKEDEIEIVEPQPQTAFGEFAEFDYLKKFDDSTKQIIEPIMEMISKGNSYSDIEKNLFEMFPKLDTKEIEDYIQKSLAVATLSGIVKNVK